MIMDLGLDVATSTGMARCYNDQRKIYVVEHTGGPLDLMTWIRGFLPEENCECRFTAEQHNHFRNAATARGLLMRLGYVVHSLQEDRHSVVMANAMSVRSWIKAKNKEAVLEAVRSRVIAIAPGVKKLTDNHSDAVALLLWAKKWALDEVEVVVGMGENTLKKARKK